MTHPAPEHPSAAQAFESTRALLNDDGLTSDDQSAKGFLAPIGSVVGLRNVVANPPSTEEEVLNASLVSPNRGHNPLFRALEELDGIEKDEAEWQLKNPQTSLLTSIVTGNEYQSPKEAIETLDALCQSVPRRVCQHPFKRNDIVWVCRTCQADETCVLCHNCYTQSNHEGHDVAFYHAQAGGCCDCGDPDAWDPAGFCPHHGPTTTGLGPLSSDTVDRVRGVVPAVIDWMVDEVASLAERAHERASPAPPQQRLQEAANLVPMPPFGGTSSNSEFPSNSRRIVPSEVGFDPIAAGSNKAVRTQNSMEDDEGGNTKLSKAESLGILARNDGGLFLVLKADDIHTTHQLVDAVRDLIGVSSPYTDSLLNRLVKALRQHGQLVIWGTMELLTELNSTQIKLWLDGDRVASGLLGTAMLSRALLANSHGLCCSIMTLKELQLEQRAVAIMQWLTCLARSCDPLCQTVAESIGPDRHLVPLLRADFKLSSRITKYWHSLLLTLLAVPTFKSHLAAAYCDTYQAVTAEYASGKGVLERSGYALSVQFLNRVTYVVDLVQHRDLLGKLGASLHQTLSVAANPRLDPNHFILTHRRYSPCISDLKCVLNVKGMPRLFASHSKTFLQDWVAALSLGQMMDPQVWRAFSEGHVEVELRGWVGAFNASISLGSLFERLLSWDDNDPSPIDDPETPLVANLWSCVQLTSHIMAHGLSKWQRSESASYKPTPYTSSLEPFQRRSASLPFSTISAKHGSVLAFSALPASQVTPFSFHLPLHRFVAACLREVCLRPAGIQQLEVSLLQSLSVEDYDNMCTGLMEFPLLVLTRAAQIRAGLWRRNGNGLNDQVLNYAEPPFCRPMRDADILLVQFGILGRTKYQTRDRYRPSSDVGTCFFVHLILHRLGLFDFCGLAKAPNSDINLYLDEVQQGFYDAEHNADDAMGDDFLLPWTYSPAKDASNFLLLLEEFLHTMIILISELPPVSPVGRNDHVAQAKWRLRREVVHRLASGPKTHSELAEVHHVLSHWDNMYLSEEGKLINPDDATGAALGVVLSEVASRKVSRAKMEPDKWHLNRETWVEYDPSFFHISLRNHQSVAESRPAIDGTNINYGIAPKAFCPEPPVAHAAFARLRRDLTSDASLLAIVYRTLHIHCRDVTKKKDAVNLRGAMAYEGEEKSETAIARAVHILTLGAYAWKNATPEDATWREKGGGSIGSIFFDRGDEDASPTARVWVSAALLASPKLQQACDWYDGEEPTLKLLHRLAADGGYEGCFIAQDRAVRAGAAWLCDFAAENNPDARSVVHTMQGDKNIENGADASQETEIQKRKRIAKEKAMERMKAQAAKFASMMETELGSKDDSEDASMKDEDINPSTPQTAAQRRGSAASAKSFASSDGSATHGSDRVTASFTSPDSQRFLDEEDIPPRLLRNRPQCIICSDDSNAEARIRDYDDSDGHRKSRRRRTDGGNALAFVGYSQASTVMKGGGGAPSMTGIYTDSVPVCRFVGAHVALCGHAVHSECWESYLSTVSHREERPIGKRDEFRCPLCQRLSNCLVPFIDVAVDWVDPAPVVSESMTHSKIQDSIHTEVDMPIEPMSSVSTSSSLHRFLTRTPWWVFRHNDSIVWDGQCAFVSNIEGKPEASIENKKKASNESSRRHSVRPLRKKDLYAAWNAMMKTPRFVRRKMRPRPGKNVAISPPTGDSAEEPHAPTVSTDSTGETVVWRRFMDQISDLTYRADGKRLGDENLHNDFGEFRHYVVEKYAYNMANRFAGKEPSDWPSCVFRSPLTDTHRQELSREKLLSKLTMSIQAFTYSVCCESHEARRVVKKATMASNKSATMAREENTMKVIFSKFGIAGLRCHGKLLIMPQPSSSADDGSQPFNGRLGKLRYLGLSVMAAAGAVAADLVQLVLPFPVPAKGVDVDTRDGDENPCRAPIVYPILFGHVLTHVAAVICASGGRERARSDSLEVVWPVPFSSRGSFLSKETVYDADSAIEDSEGFLKLGLLARILQVLLGKLAILEAGNQSLARIAIEEVVASSDDSFSPENQWRLACAKLVDIALCGEQETETMKPSEASDSSRMKNNFIEGCSVAAEAACTYLSEAGIILQVLLPGAVAKYSSRDIDIVAESANDGSSLTTLQELLSFFRIEPLVEMMQSDHVQTVVSGWYKDAQRHRNASDAPDNFMLGSRTSLCSRLYRTQGFRVLDWPMDSLEANKSEINLENKKMDSHFKGSHDQASVEPMDIDPIGPAGVQVSSTELNQRQLPDLVTFNAKKSVPLLGGYPPNDSVVKTVRTSSGRPRVTRIPTSYTDLYAVLGQLLPESEQTAVCLICGEVLNAGGKGECTRHSYTCGAGTGMFFLLQECAGLIIHNGKAAYIHSPYVDSHGETPQYRGRPLNLDLDRYDHLHEVWSGHAIRQQVVTERGESRQVIVPDFY